MTKLIALSQYPSTQSHEKKRGVDASILKRGFTLIEMVVTLSIIAILAVVITTQFGGDSAKATKMLSDAESIKKAALRFKTDTGYYPCTLDALYSKVTDFEGPNEYRWCANGASGWAGPYLQKGFNPSLTGNTHGVVGYNLTVREPGFNGAPISSGRSLLVVMWPVPKSVADEYLEKCSLGSTQKCAFHLNSTFNNEPGPYHLFYHVGYMK